jgi:hypothetical protein
VIRLCPTDIIIIIIIIIIRLLRESYGSRDGPKHGKAG